MNARGPTPPPPPGTPPVPPSDPSRRPPITEPPPPIPIPRPEPPPAPVGDPPGDSPSSRLLMQRGPQHIGSGCTGYRTEPEKGKKGFNCACYELRALGGVKSMRNLMLATASAIVLSMAGAGIGHAAQQHSIPADTPA